MWLTVWLKSMLYVVAVVRLIPGMSIVPKPMEKLGKSAGIQSGGPKSSRNNWMFYMLIEPDLSPI